MINYRERTDKLGRIIYSRKGMTDRQLRITGTVLCVALCVATVVMCGLAIYYMFKTGSL